MNNKELENIIITIDTHEEVNKQDKTRIKAIKEWGNRYGAIIEHRELALCDYSLVGEFRERKINLGVEYKTWDNFLGDSIDDMEDKLTRSKELYTDVALFVETSNYTFKPIIDSCHCNLEYSETAKIAMMRNGNTELKGKTLASMEGFFDTLQANGIHVRQLRGEAQFPYSLHNLLIYLTHPHQLKIKNLTYETWLIQHYMTLPGIGYVKAKNLIKSFPNPFWLNYSSEKNISGIVGKTAGKMIYEYLRGNELETKNNTNTNIHLCDTCIKGINKSIQMSACDADSDSVVFEHDNSNIIHCDVYIKNSSHLPESDTILSGSIPPPLSGSDNISQSQDIKQDIPVSGKKKKSKKRKDVTLLPEPDILDTLQSSNINTGMLPTSAKNSAGRANQIDIDIHDTIPGTNKSSGITGHSSSIFTPIPPNNELDDKKQQGSSCSSSAAPPIEDFLGLNNPITEYKEHNKLTLNENLKEYLKMPHILQDIVDQHAGWGKGYVFDHVMGGIKSNYFTRTEKIENGKVVFYFQRTDCI